MPEGPSIVIAKETISPVFKSRKVTAVKGNANIEKEQLTGKKILAVRSWGKHLLISMEKHTVRIHFLLFGSYSIDEQTKQDRSLRLALIAGKHTLYLYTCSIKLLPANITKLYDWEADLLNKKWNAAKAKKKLKDMPGTMACDALLDQTVFAGSGNIIKNEVLYRIKLHPETLVGDIPLKKLNELIREARNYSFDFLKWKKAFELKKHWLAHTKKTCLRCDLPFEKKYCGKTKRRTFFCTNCQLKYE